MINNPILQLEKLRVTRVFQGPATNKCGAVTRMLQPLETVLAFCFLNVLIACHSCWS